MATPIRVLIVEDQQSDVELILHALRHDGFEPEWKCVESESEFAREVLGTWDIILADYTLPQFSALDALLYLRRNRLNFPFIVVTGTVNEEVAIACIKEGADDYLLKDRLARLGAAVRHALEAKQVRDEARRAEDALREQARLLDLALDAIVVRDLATGAIRFWNAGAEKAYGWNREQVYGESIDVLLRTEFPRPVANLEADLLESGQWEGELVRVARDGRRVSVWSRWALQRDAQDHPVAVLMIDHDIGERLAAEETRLALAREQVARAVAESERRRLADLFDQAPASILATRGPEHNIDLVSPRFLRTVNWHGDESPVGLPFAEAFPWFFQSGAGEILDSVYKDGLPVAGTEMAWPVGRPDGEDETAYFNVVWQPIRDHVGKVEGVLFLAVEVSELVRARKRIEELAAEAEAARARLEGVLAQLPAGVMIADAQTEQLILANTQVERIFRRPLSPGDSVLGFYAGCELLADGLPVAAEEWPLIRSIRYGETVLGEETDIARRDGSRATIRMSSAPIRDRDARLIAGVVTIDDVTERKRSEGDVRFLSEASQVLSQSLDLEGTLQAAVNLPVPRLADVCLVFLTRQGASVDCAAVAVNHASPLAKVSDWASRLTFEPRITNAVSLACRNGAASRGSLFDLLGRPSGESSPDLRDVPGACVPLIARGQIGGALLLGRSQAAPYDSADLGVAEEIARRVAIAMDNARLYQLSQEALRARDQFLSFASHDLKNPLSAIKGTTQLLQRRAARLENGNAERFTTGLANIDAAATRMTAMIGELLDVARLQMGQTISLNRQPTDLVAVTNDLVAQHHQASPRHRITVEATSSELIGDWDGPRLERVLDNLLSNATKYSPEGGTVQVTLAREQDSGGAWAVLRVSDQGIGIPASDLPHIFESFRRAKNAMGSRPGVGLGLAGSRQIVNLHGGQILVESQEGEGSTFIVRLPL